MVQDVSFNGLKLLDRELHSRSGDLSELYVLNHTCHHIEAGVTIVQ